MGRHYIKSTVPTIDFNQKTKFEVLKGKTYILKFEDGGEKVHLTTLKHAIYAMCILPGVVEDFNSGEITWYRELTALADNEYIRVWSDGRSIYADIIGNDPHANCQIYVSELDGSVDGGVIKSGALLG
jgi:hypothetical protein